MGDFDDTGNTGDFREDQILAVATRWFKMMANGQSIRLGVVSDAHGVKDYARIAYTPTDDDLSASFVIWLHYIPGSTPDASGHWESMSHADVSPEEWKKNGKRIRREIEALGCPPLGAANLGWQ